MTSMPLGEIFPVDKINYKYRVKTETIRTPLKTLRTDLTNITFYSVSETSVEERMELPGGCWRGTGTASGKSYHLASVRVLANPLSSPTEIVLNDVESILNLVESIYEEQLLRTQALGSKLPG